MPTLLNKSIQLQRYHVGVMAVVVALCALAILRYVELLRAEVEAFTVRVSLSKIQEGMTAENLLDKSTTNCQFLNNSQFLSGNFILLPLFTSSETLGIQSPSPWEYLPKQHRLIYHVNATHFFRSPSGPQITIDFICQHNEAMMQVHEYHWCLNRGFWGCSD